MKKIFSNKSYGFFVTIGLALLSIATMIVYLVSYKGVIATNSTKEIFSWPAFIFLVVWLVAFVASLFVPQLAKYVHYVGGICLTLAACFFIYGIYFQVSVMAVGIDAKFDSKFFLNTIFFGLLWVGSLINVFLPQVKKEESAK